MMAGGFAWSMLAAKGQRGFYWALAAYVLATLGASGDLEWHLRRWFIDYQNPTKILLPLGGIAWGVWLFGFRLWRRERAINN
ncbi:hypothetical protein AGMMS49959_10130 [Planctomycetales bacterium]|nr:hypothetical protein AGMMS49959_10130 [Planctomycetales bacterium]